MSLVLHKRWEQTSATITFSLMTLLGLYSDTLHSFGAFAGPVRVVRWRR